MTSIATRLMTSGLAGCLMALGTTVFSRAEEPRADETAAALMRRASAAENAQRTNEAAAAYERLLRLDTAFEAVVAPRLVTLYVGSGQEAPALAWAARAARRSPDPKAYLAGVHARLGQWKEAELLLRQAVREVRDPRKRVALLWQLADAQERQGESKAALATLTDARDATADEALQKTSAQRLDALHRRFAAAQTNQPHTRGTPPAEDAR